MTILVFPSSIEAAARFADDARHWGRRVVGASSLDTDPFASRYDAWERLPLIDDETFFDALGALVARQDIQSIFTPHAPSFNFLESELPSRLPQIAVIGEGPYRTHVKQVQLALEKAQGDRTAIAALGITSEPLPVQFVAGLLGQMDRLYGQCSREKALAVCAIMPSAVKGDVVEIGCMFGKSAYLFNRLASHCGVGTTLAIDPWNLELSIQHEAPLNIQDASRKWNWDVVHQGFLINMLACTGQPFNYMRAASADAYARYCAEREVVSAEFGATALAGSISVLHIDGNHDEAAVAQDFQLWSRRMASGAWVIFDDYDWLHGDGPRKVADRAVRAYGARVRRRFVAGGALFLQVDA